MDITADAAEALDERRGPRWTGWFVLGTLGVVVAGGWGATRSLTALAARTEQLEREAAESEARVAELQGLREGLTRRVRLLEAEHARPPPSRPASPRRTAELSARRDAARQTLAHLLQDERERGRAWLEEGEGHLRLALGAPLLFAPQGSALTPEGTALLDRVGAALAVEGHQVQVAAWPDASPSGWEQSTARAVAVARAVAHAGALAPERLVALGYGAAAPPSPDAVSPVLPGARVELRLVPAPDEPRTSGALRR